MSINKRIVSIAALTLMIGLPLSFACGQQPASVTKRTKSAAASSVSSRIKGQIQQRAQAQVQNKIQTEIQQQAAAQAQAQLKANVNRAAQLAQKAVAASQARTAATNRAQLKRLKSKMTQPAAAAVTADTRVPRANITMPRTGTAQPLANTKIPAIEKRQRQAGTVQPLVDTKIRAADMKRREAEMELPHGITPTDVKLYDNIFGQFNPFRADSSTLPGSVNHPPQTDLLDGNISTRHPGSENRKHTNLVAAWKEKTAGDFQTELGPRIEAAIQHRRAAISLMRDKAIENSDQQKLQAADKMEMILNTFVEAQAKAKAGAPPNAAFQPTQAVESSANLRSSANGTLKK